MCHTPHIREFRERKSDLQSVLLERNDSGFPRIFESCRIRQTEKSEHTLTRGQLQNMNIPVEKWQEVSIDFVTDLPDEGGRINSIMMVIDKATRMTHLIHCTKSISAAQTAKLYMQYIVKLHGIPRVIYTDRRTQFVSKFWRDL